MFIIIYESRGSWDTLRDMTYWCKTVSGPQKTQELSNTTLLVNNKKGHSAIQNLLFLEVIDSFSLPLDQRINSEIPEIHSLEFSSQSLQ